MSMNIENMTLIPPVEIGYILNPDLPVIPFSMDVKDAGCAAPHKHPRGQLIYSGNGTMKVICEKDIWIVPSSQAVWVPPFTEHEVFFPGEVTIRNLFIDPDFTSGLSGECMVFEVSPLLRELVSKISDKQTYVKQSRTYRLMTVIIDELSEAVPTDIRLPLARDERLMRVLNELLKDPSDKRGLDDYALSAGASARTLARLFLKDTGLTFYEWRKRLRLQEAIKRLGEGEDVTGIAFDLGYSSLSAFIKMFRESIGAPPGKFAKRSK
jgi:AraC-like DNA-binding protein